MSFQLIWFIQCSCKFNRKKITRLFGCHPLDAVTRRGTTPSDATDFYLSIYFYLFHTNKPYGTAKRTRNSSGDEIANVNFLRRHRARTTKYNRLVHKSRHRSTRLCVGTHVFTKFSEITQYNGHYVAQGHSRSPILVPIESSYMTSY